MEAGAQPNQPGNSGPSSKLNSTGQQSLTNLKIITSAEEAEAEERRRAEDHIDRSFYASNRSGISSISAATAPGAAGYYFPRQIQVDQSEDFVHRPTETLAAEPKQKEKQLALGPILEEEKIDRSESKSASMTLTTGSGTAVAPQFYKGTIGNDLQGAPALKDPELPVEEVSKALVTKPPAEASSNVQADNNPSFSIEAPQQLPYLPQPIQPPPLATEPDEEAKVVQETIGGRTQPVMQANESTPQKQTKSIALTIEETPEEKRYSPEVIQDEGIPKKASERISELIDLKCLQEVKDQIDSLVETNLQTPDSQRKTRKKRQARSKIKKSVEKKSVSRKGSLSPGKKNPFILRKASAKEKRPQAMSEAKPVRRTKALRKKKTPNEDVINKLKAQILQQQAIIDESERQLNPSRASFDGVLSSKASTVGAPKLKKTSISRVSLSKLPQQQALKSRQANTSTIGGAATTSHHRRVAAGSSRIASTQRNSIDITLRSSTSTTHLKSKPNAPKKPEKPSFKKVLSSRKHTLAPSLSARKQLIPTTLACSPRQSSLRKSVLLETTPSRVKLSTASRLEGRAVSKTESKAKNVQTPQVETARGSTRGTSRKASKPKPMKIINSLVQTKRTQGPGFPLPAGQDPSIVSFFIRDSKSSRPATATGSLRKPMSFSKPEFSSDTKPQPDNMSVRNAGTFDKIFKLLCYNQRENKVREVHRRRPIITFRNLDLSDIPLQVIDLLMDLFTTLEDEERSYAFHHRDEQEAAPSQEFSWDRDAFDLRVKEFWKLRSAKERDVISRLFKKSQFF